MNDPHDFSIEPEDPALERALSGLRSIEPPLAARIQNRTAIAEALSSLTSANRRRRLPWWRRSISVPFPVAACLVLIAALALALRFRSDGEQSHAASAPSDKDAIVTSQPDARPVLVYRETATYLCGIGQLKSTHGYYFKEQDR
jgi:hypothetical protein